MIEPMEALKILATDFSRIGELNKFIQDAPARKLHVFITLGYIHNLHHETNKVPYLEMAKLAIPIRLSEDATEIANKLFQSTEQLTQLNLTHIQHTEKLTQQTDILVKESKGLSKLTKVLIWLTVALGVFAVVQIVLMVCDIWKHK
jgi:hypothetical protein